LLGCLGAIVLLLLIAGGWYVGTRNHFVDLDQAVQRQWAQVENDYQRRFDLIPNLVRTVQGAANFEKSTLEAVISARSRVGQVQAPAGGPPGAQSNLPNDPNAMAQFAGAQENLTGALSRLLVVVERDRARRDRAPRLGRAGAGHPAQAHAVGERLQRQPAQRIADSATEREAGGLLQEDRRSVPDHDFPLARRRRRPRIYEQGRECLE